MNPEPQPRRPAPAPVPWQIRPLAPHDGSEAEALLLRLGAEHLYLRNQLASESSGVCEGELVGVFGLDGLGAVAFLGDRGQIAAAVADPRALLPLARAALLRDHDWRLFVGPAPIARQLRGGLGHVRLYRDQPFYLVRPGDPIPRTPAGEAVRAAEPADRERLTLATLELNREDLGIAHARVNLERLRQHVEQRIAEGSVFVVGPVGDFHAKLELGSTGPGGILIEGVYTFPDVRGQGLARQLVAGVARHFTEAGTVVGLHCAASNRSARRVYEASGMRVVADWMLILADPGRIG